MRGNIKTEKINRSKNSRIISTHVCDDARVEINGKYILIGVYTTNIVFPFFPVHFRFVVWFEFEPTKFGESVISLRIFYDGVQINELEVKIQVQGALEATGISSPPMIMNVGGAGELRVDAAIDGSPYTPIKRTKIVVGDVLQVAAFPPS